MEHLTALPPDPEEPEQRHPGGRIAPDVASGEGEASRAELRRLSQAVALHQDLSRLALDGANLSQLARALARRAGNPVLIESRFFQPLAVAPDAPTVDTIRGDPRAIAQALRRVPDGQPIRLGPDRGGLPREQVVAPIVVARQVLGYISIIEDTQPLSADETFLIQHAALAVAIEFARRRAALDAELRLKGNLLDLLLEVVAEDRALAERAALLGFDVAGPRALLVIAPDAPSSPDGEDYPALTSREVADLLTAWAQPLLPDCLIALKDDRVVLLAGTRGLQQLPADPPRRPRGLNGQSAGSLGGGPTVGPVGRLIGHLRRAIAAARPEATVSIAVAPSVTDWRELRRAYGVASRAQAVLRLLGEPGQIVCTTDPRLAIFFLLDGADGEVVREFVEIVLGSLLAYDSQHGRSLIATLDAYLAAEGNRETIARHLNIHTSTLKYRLQRIAEIGGLDLRNPDHRFNAALALKLRAVVLRESTPR